MSSMEERLARYQISYEEYAESLKRMPCKICGNPNEKHDLLTREEAANLRNENKRVIVCATWEEDIARLDPDFRLRCWVSDIEDPCDEGFMEEISS